ncbi:autotransporter assembly complex protein TamA [Maricaulis sp.]|uniref:autotransporter assembly complex protein TamA n=1 Tax=Maricaulis sp. TaxID=1486257 RepID=UPI003A90F9DF
MKSLIVSLAILMACGPAFAAPLSTIEGIADPVLRDALQAAVGARAESENPADGPMRQARTAADRARRLLRSEGYYRAQVDPRLDDNSQAVIHITLGPRVRIATIDAVTTPDTEAAPLARAAITLSRDAPLRAADVIASDALGLAALQDAGWPSAESGDRQVRVDHATDTAIVQFVYDTGPYSVYGPFELDGDNWRPGFIAALSPLTRGATASRTQILEYQRRLDALTSVRTSQVMLGEADPATSERPVRVELTPASRHSIEASLSFATSEGAGANFDWTRRNMFLGDETLTVEASIATLQQGLGATLTLPHWRRYQQTLLFSAGVQSQETDAFDQTGLLVTAGVTRRAGHLEYGAGTRLDISQVTDTTGPRDANTLALDLSAAYDTRNNPLDPDEGLRARLQISPAATFGDVETRYVGVEARASSYYRLSDDLVAAARVRIGTVLGTSAESLPADLRLYAGGGGSVRGYSYQSLSPLGSDGSPFGGLSVTETSLELRWRARERWGAVAFLDSGTASTASTPDFAEFRSAVGVGVRYYFDFAPVRFDIATPLDRRSDDAALQIYFSLGQAF